MFSFRFRKAASADVTRAIPLLARDRELFPATWKAIPGLLRGLIDARCASAHIVEEVVSSKVCFFGVAAFVDPRVAAQAAAKPYRPFREKLFSSVLAGRGVFLNPGRLAAANATGELSIVHLFGCADEPDYSTPRAYELHRIAFEAFGFAYGGYRIREFWQEAIDPGIAAMLESSSVPEVRPPLRLERGQARLFCFAREQAESNPLHPLTLLMKCPPAKFRFTRPQQAMLELALLEVSDREAADQLDLTEDAIKKRWRGIYSAVDIAEPRLLSAAASGAERRRVLLGYLRQHLEELRPLPPRHKSTPSV